MDLFAFLASVDRVSTVIAVPLTLLIYTFVAIEPYPRA